MTEILHRLGSLDEDRDIETDEGDIKPITDDFELAPPVADMWPEYPTQEDPADPIEIPSAATTEKLNSTLIDEDLEKRIEDLADKRGISYEAARKSIVG